MKRALRCLGFVLLGIGGAALAAVVLFAGSGALFWLSAATAAWFDLPVKYGVLFMLGYIILGVGGFVGGVLCREDRT